MPQLLAICDSCGTAFPSGIVLENSPHSRFSNNTSGPCPKCGGTGRVPDGGTDEQGQIYYIKEAYRALRELDLTRQELEKLATVLQEAAARGEDSPERLAEEVRQEVPKASVIERLLPKDAAQ